MTAYFWLKILFFLLGKTSLQKTAWWINVFLSKTARDWLKAVPREFKTCQSCFSESCSLYKRQALVDQWAKSSGFSWYQTQDSRKFAWVLYYPFANFVNRMSRNQHIFVECGTHSTKICWLRLTILTKVANAYYNIQSCEYKSITLIQKRTRK